MRIDPRDLRILKSRAVQPGIPPPRGEWLPGRRGFRIFVVGRLVNPLSQTPHWRVEHRRREQWDQGVANALLGIHYRRGDFDPAARKRITMIAHVARKFDSINFAGAILKPLPDALVRFGILNDDRDSAGHEWPQPTQVIDRQHQGVEITVQLLEPPG